MRKFIISFLVGLLFISSCEHKTDTDNSDLQKEDSILFVDILPDTIIMVKEYGNDTTISYDFDINMDSINDFRMSASYWPSFQTPSCDEGFRISIKSLNEKSKVGIRNNANCDALSIDSTSKIDENIQWANYGLIYYRDCQYFGYNCSICYYISDCVIPLSITINENKHYGWVLFTFQYQDGGPGPYDDLSVTIKKYALNLIPNSPITFKVGGLF